jgi:hypothetical protein
LVIVKPETLIGWQRKGFQLFWRGKSQAGRPRIPENIRKLIVQMAQENPRVAAELSVKLGIYVSPRTVRAYWPEPERRGNGRTSSQNWRTFVRNHAKSIVACDFLVVVTSGPGASCIATSPRIQRRPGPCSSFAKRFRAIIPIVTSSQQSLQQVFEQNSVLQT